MKFPYFQVYGTLA